MLKNITYNPDTGIFTRYFPYAKKTKTIGCYDTSGYLCAIINNRQYSLHRIAYLYMTGEMPEYQIDHINRIRDDNRWCNLREATHTTNQRNRSINKNNKSGAKGVYFNKALNKWHSQIRIDGKRVHLGFFDLLEDAISARLVAENNNGYL